jgi:hypothetical protein
VRTQQPETCLECGSIAVERNRFFTGKYMTARDFAGEQEYFLTHHRLHNRLLHGWGIVCGLAVTRHPSPDCADRWVVVRAGIGIDCCGRELVLRKDTAFELPLPQPSEETAPERAADVEPAAGGYDEEPQEPEREQLLLCLRYCEEDVELVPTLYAEGQCDPTRHEANRIREVASIDVRRLDDVDPDCWRTQEGSMEAPCRDDCDDEPTGESPGCIDPYCPCGTCLPLALISYDPLDQAAGFELDLSGRRLLPPPADYLTHIVGYNWPHGGELSLDDLVDRDGRLEVRFDRRLAEPIDEALGVSEFTFVVQYGNVQRDLEFLPFDPDRPPGLDEDDPCVAVFRIDPDYYQPRARRDTIAGSSVYVSLKCDFIPDCHGNSVSGRHLGAALPTGDGSPGGLFESWFRVVPGGGEKEA